MICEQQLRNLYQKQGQSMQDIANDLQCSIHKIQYWLHRYDIPRRSISDAIYLKHNPHGDPFKLVSPRTLHEAFLFGLGIGLYWGEGTKSNKYAVRLGNTNPLLIGTFVEFLVTFFGIRRKDLRFGLQIFSDISPEKALDFWRKTLKIPKHQFYRTTITKSGSIGTYRTKCRHGVLTVYYHNKKLRDLIVSLLPS